MKIMIDVTPLMNTKTGIGYYTERLLTNLSKIAPEDVELVGFYYNFLGRRDASKLPRAKNIRYTRLSLVPSKIVYQLRRWGVEFPVELFTLERADFVLYPNFLDHPSLAHSPSAPVIHDLTYLDMPQYVAPKLRGDLTRFVPKALARSAFAITVSEFTKQEIVKRYQVDPEKILVTHIPALPVTPIAEQERRQTLQQLNISKPFLLFVGTIDPRKNISGLVDAYTKLPESLRKQFSLVIAGRIELLGKADARKLTEAREQGHDIIHLGYTTDEVKEVLYQSATLFVSASKYEGFGMPLLEAMCHGIPCAISKIPVFVEVGGEAAAYFDPNDSENIAKTITQLLKRPDAGRKLGDAGRKHAATYKWETIAGEVLRRIESTVSHRTT